MMSMDSFFFSLICLFGLSGFTAQPTCWRRIDQGTILTCTPPCWGACGQDGRQTWQRRILSQSQNQQWKYRLSWKWALHFLHWIQFGWAGGGASAEGTAAVVGHVDCKVGAGEGEDGDGAGDEAGEGEGGNDRSEHMEVSPPSSWGIPRRLATTADLLLERVASALESDLACFPGWEVSGVDWPLGGGSESISVACCRACWAGDAGIAGNVDKVDGECPGPDVEGHSCDGGGEADRGNSSDGCTCLLSGCRRTTSMAAVEAALCYCEARWRWSFWEVEGWGFFLVAI